MRRFILRPLATVLALFSLSAAAFADPPGRVGRVSYIEGQVSFHTGDQPQWSPAALNYPATSNTAFWTEVGSRAEVEIGALEIRMDQNTELDFQRLDDDAIRINVPQGVVNVHLHAVPGGHGFQIVTPGGTISLMEGGSYHVDAGHPDASGAVDRLEVNVLEGAARFQGARSSLDIMPGEGAIFTPTGFNLIETNATDFDNWALARERREMASNAARYLPPDVTGYQDLDRNGNWSTLAGVGPVWIPAAVPSDWAPYRFGHWAFVAPWGWTWIDDAPWGFAPFHYGRWIESPAGWAWCPGTFVERPVYAPALVAFVGGANWSLSLAAGPPRSAVGWVPLGPAEAFHPYYRASEGYARRVNRNDVRSAGNGPPRATVTNYVNRHAATVVPAAAFTSAANVHHATLALPPEQMGRAPVTSDIGRLRPSPAAHAGVALPGAARASVPAPGTPAVVVERGSRSPSQPFAPARRNEAPLVIPGAATIPPGPGPQSPRPHWDNHAMHGTEAGAPAQQPAAAPRPQAIPRQSPPMVPQQRAAPPMPAVQRQAPPTQPMAVERPAQQTRLQPTPQGWNREPRPQPQQPPQQHHEPAHDQPHGQPHQGPPNNEHR